MLSTGTKYRLKAWLNAQRVISRKALLLDVAFSCLIGISLAYALFIGLSS
jgi:hypothetical protein